VYRDFDEPRSFAVVNDGDRVHEIASNDLVPAVHGSGGQLVGALAASILNTPGA
jgi:hypothetical protein